MFSCFIFDAFIFVSVLFLFSFSINNLPPKFQEHCNHTDVTAVGCTLLYAFASSHYHINISVLLTLPNTKSICWNRSILKWYVYSWARSKGSLELNTVFSERACISTTHSKRAAWYRFVVLHNIVLCRTECWNESSLLSMIVTVRVSLNRTLPDFIRETHSAYGISKLKKLPLGLFWIFEKVCV